MVICEVDDLINIVENEYKNGSFSYKDIEIITTEYGLCFSTPAIQNNKTTTFTISIYIPLKIISSLINGTEKINEYIIIKYPFTYPFSIKLYPYIKSLWENYMAEINYYN